MIDPARREELNAIRREQRELRARLQTLEKRVEQFERVSEEDGEDATLAAMLAEAPPPPAPVPMPVLPPPLSISREPQLPIAPPRLPVLAQTAPPPASEAVSGPSLPPLSAGPPPPAVPRESLEMQIGTTWLVRAGVVFLLTALAFAGSWLYYNIVPTLGPAAKLALMYLGAGALTGVGAWLERSRFSEQNDALKNYARVVLAGGLAAVYYVTYSAHWNPHLCIVRDPLLAGGLLLGWAAFMVWLSDRRRSELLATFAILLAFYTSAINEIGLFTLAANLFLAAGAVFLLRRQLWRIFPFVSLLATFGSYGFWRFSHAFIEASPLADGTPPHVALTAARFWIESGFLLLYWILFTWAVFTSDDQVLPGRRRAGFVTVNNSALFLLITWLLLSVYPGNFWKLSLGFGTVLLALAETSRRVPRVRAVGLESAYLLHGVLLVTTGLIAYFSDWQLGLVLAVQSVVMLSLSRQRENRLLLLSSYAVGVISAVYTVRTLHADTGAGAVDSSMAYVTRTLPNLGGAEAWAVGLGVGAFLVANAAWCQRAAARRRADLPAGEAGPMTFHPMVAALPSWFASFGALVGYWTIEIAVSSELQRTSLLAVAAVLLTASIYVLRLRALPWAAQVFLSMAHLHWLLTYGRLLDIGVAPLWNPLVLLASTLALGHWWLGQRITGAEGRTAKWNAAGWDAILVVLLLNFWLRQHAPGGSAGWMAEAAGLSVALLGYGMLTRYRALAVAGQFLLAASVWNFVQQWDHSWTGTGAERWLALSPLVAMLTVLVVSHRFAPPGTPDHGAVARIARVYEVAATGLFLAWVGRYVPRSVQVALLTLAGAGVFALGCVSRNRRWQLLSAVPTAAGLFVFFLVEDARERQHWLGLTAAAILAGQQQFGKRWLKEDTLAWFPAKAQGTLMTAAVFCAWAFLTARMARWEGSAFTLAASWSLFAPLVFAAGLVLHERVYRWLGLLVLAATLGHIVLFDISQMDALGKAISFFALGLVVMGVGFCYVRFQSKFRDFL